MSASSAQAIDMEDLDPFDPLHRLDGLANDPLELLDQSQARCGAPRLQCRHVLRFIHEARTFGINLVPQLEGDRLDLLGIGFRFCLCTHCDATIGRGGLLGFGGDGEAQGIPLGFLRGDN